MIGKNSPPETPHRIEPCVLEPVPLPVADLISDLSAASARLESGLPAGTARTLAELVRMMNCYYSNLIEGHNTRPREIELALKQDLGTGERRNLQLEAAAHVEVQRVIDQRAAAGTLGEPAGSEFIQWVHRSFYEAMPEEFLKVGEGKSAFRMEPGAFRSRPAHDNIVGRHVPPSSAHVHEFMRYFESRYRFEGSGTAFRVVAMAAAHHRFNYVHPFPDGNGRVSRLMSHAMGHLAGIGAHGLWSVSRGLARGLTGRADYKQMMDAADSPREGDLDGRGTLSLRQLIVFVEWFLKVCIDQVRFMSGLFDLAAVRPRLARLVDRMGLKAEAAALLDSVWLRGEMPRGEAARATGLPERTARQLLGRCLSVGLLGSESPKGPVSVRFTLDSAETVFPNLFPEI